MIDTHLHLSHQRFDRDREAVLERARAAGVVAAIEVGWDLDSSQAAISLAARHPGFLFPAAGIHPHYVGDAPPRAMETVRLLAAEAPIVAVGETGLDLYRNLSPQERQEELFRQHIHLAREIGLPLIVHSRAATDRVLTILTEEGAASVGGVLHCFSGARARQGGARDPGGPAAPRDRRPLPGSEASPP
jgi:TatD DNase family protein